MKAAIASKINKSFKLHQNARGSKNLSGEKLKFGTQKNQKHVQHQWKLLSFSGLIFFFGYTVSDIFGCVRGYWHDFLEGILFVHRVMNMEYANN